MDIRLGDILVMKKAHPCGQRQWKVLRTGMDFRLKCLGCGHEVLLPRVKAEKNIKSVLREPEPSARRRTQFPAAGDGWMQS